MESESRRIDGIVTTNELIEALIKATSTVDSPLHEYVYREALLGLVRLAKAEKLLEIKRDIALSIGLDSGDLPRRH